MLFNSFEFVLFLPLAWAAWWACRGNLRLQNLAAVAASCVFYGWWDWRFLVLIAVTSFWAWGSGIALSCRKTQGGDKLIVFAALAVNLGILGAFKYWNFFADSAAGLLNALGFNAHLSSLEIILPVGISFYTFQALSYVLDVYRGNIAATRDPVAFFAFVGFFPQLVAGPIERATNLLPQFLKPRKFDYALAVEGCRQILWGFFKKMAVADCCAVAANRYLNDPACGNGLMILCGTFLFSIQIYCDFSGYSDIAIGCAKLFGIRLMRNFAFPYFARDIAEFWRRWHVSLTTWFRDYLYIPLGGSRCGKAKMVRNTFAIFLVSGLWHGANWTFVAWGAFHALLFLPLLLGGRNRRHLSGVAEDRALPSVPELCGMLGTFALAMLGWMLFRAPSIPEAVRWLCAMFDFAGYGFDPGFPHEGKAVFPLIGLMLGVEWFNRREQFGFARMPPWGWLRKVVYFAVILLIFLYAPGSQTFIYFQF